MRRTLIDASHAHEHMSGLSESGQNYLLVRGRHLVLSHYYLPTYSVVEGWSQKHSLGKLRSECGVIRSYLQ